MEWLLSKIGLGFVFNVMRDVLGWLSNFRRKRRIKLCTDLLVKGRHLHQTAPARRASRAEAEGWLEQYQRWVDEARNKLTKYGSAGVTKFDNMMNLPPIEIPGKQVYVRDSLVRLERQLENLSAIIDRSDNYLA
jgi:hypothetical protein